MPDAKQLWLPRAWPQDGHHRYESRSDRADELKPGHRRHRQGPSGAYAAGIQFRRPYLASGIAALERSSSVGTLI